MRESLRRYHKMIERFLSETSRNPRVSNWQVQQARNAIETYYEKFRGIPLSPRTEGEDLTISRQTISVGRETTLQTLSFPTSSGYYTEPSPAVKLFSASIDLASGRTHDSLTDHQSVIPLSRIFTTETRRHGEEGRANPRLAAHPVAESGIGYRNHQSPLCATASPW